MSDSSRRVCAAAMLLLALATVIGALGTHALKARLPADQYAVLQTAVSYQFYHALGLLGLGALLQRLPLARLQTAAWLICTGVVLFSGSLYALVAGAPRLLGVLTPIGGVALIVGWLLAAYGVLRSPASSPVGDDAR